MARYNVGDITIGNYTIYDAELIDRDNSGDLSAGDSIVEGVEDSDDDTGETQNAAYFDGHHFYRETESVAQQIRRTEDDGDDDEEESSRISQRVSFNGAGLSRYRINGNIKSIRDQISNRIRAHLQPRQGVAQGSMHISITNYTNSDGERPLATIIVDRFFQFIRNTLPF